MEGFFPTLTAVSDNLVLLVVPELEDHLKPILKAKDNDVKYNSRWFLSKEDKKLVLQVDWSIGEQSNIVLSEEQQKHLVPEILEKGQIGLMFDYDPEAEAKTSGVLVISQADEGLRNIADQV